MYEATMYEATMYEATMYEATMYEATTDDDGRYRVRTEGNEHEG